MCERTQDFLQFVQIAQASVPALKRSKVSSKDLTKVKTAFNDAVGDIARGIHRTSTLLSKLTNLVKKQGLFDDPTEEINNLIHRIKQDLDELNTKCDTAQQVVDSKKSFFSEGGQSSAHNNKVVSGLKTELMTTTKDFKSILELRSNKMKDQQIKKTELIGRGMLSPMRDLETQSALIKRGHVPLPSPYADIEGGDSHYHSRREVAQEQQQLLLEPIATSQYYEAREQAVGEVERTIGELGTLFKRLSTMLAEQSELVERIDEDVENAVANTHSARAALQKAYESVSSNRGMYLKLFAVIGAFILFFVLFVL
jgi:syntaxin 5